MSARYPPPPRERSPTRYDRRPSNAYPGSYRGAADTSQPPLDRPPPRGPKADTFRGGYQFSQATRGRGGPAFSRGPSDSWDRERERERERDRDVRPPLSSYRTRDDDRSDWPRRDRDGPPLDRPALTSRDSRPYLARDRSASPTRLRRDSRESVPPLQDRGSDAGTPYYPPAARGGLSRGRGRGDWDRSRGRSSFAVDRDRDLFAPPRSRSRDSWRERELDRERPAVTDETRGDRFDRRDHERGREQEGNRGRPYESWPRDVSPARGSASINLARAGSPAQPTSAAPPFYNSERSSKLDYELGRRSSAVITPGSGGRDTRRDNEQADYFGSNSRRDTSVQPSKPSPASAGGLDYGPPPSVPAVPPSLAEKPPPPRGQAPKQELVAAPRAAFQPPSGPKADRPTTSTSNIPIAKALQPFDPHTKTDVFKSNRPPTMVAAVASTEASRRQGDYRSDARAPTVQVPEKSLSVNVPSAPRAILGAHLKPRQQAVESVSPSMPQGKPSDSRSLSIPTGPRSEREPNWSAAGSVNRSWISPEYGRAKPSIMNPISRDRPAFAPTGPRSQTMLQPQPRINPHPTPSSAVSAPASASLIQKPAMPGQHRPMPGGIGSEDVEMSLPGSSDDDVEEDEFDEDDYAASEAKYMQERRLLEAKKPPPLLQDPAVRGLLVKIQFLHMILHGVIPQAAEDDTIPEERIQEVENAQTSLPSPPEQPGEKEDGREEPKHPMLRGRPLSQAPVNPIPTPPIDDLPFLLKVQPKLAVFDESDDEVEHEAVTTLIRQNFESAAFDWQDVIVDMRADFKQRYPVWKSDVNQLEQERREIQASPAPASPAPSAAPSVTPSLPHERTRGARNTTEADLQAAILMSQQSLKEEEERREREAASNSQPNYDTEAVLPPMLKPTEIDQTLFEDTNRLIPSNIALDVFAYIPPEDDFTEQEQLAFISAYCQAPKKWGKIADALEKRSYQDCITHYYLTKNEANYKEIWRRSQPKRKRGRAAKPRSTALMSELVYGGEEGDPAVAVTDTGRPRRAAAPTFGDNQNDIDQTGQLPQPKRLAMAKDLATDPAAPKPARGRKAGVPAKPRRTKAQMLQSEQAALPPAGGSQDTSPSKAAVTPRTERARTLVRAEQALPKPDIIGAQETYRLVDAEMRQYTIAEAEQLGHPPGTVAQATSYWSVPEQQKFPQLIGYYGRDFQAVADFMKTKTVTMIKNYYNRQIADGKSDLEEVAKAAEQRRMQGDAIGPPPSPAAQTKRRYEATPSTASATRTGTLPSDSSIPEAELHAVTAKTSYTDDFPANVVRRSVTGDLVAKPRQTRDPLFRENPSIIPSPSKQEEVTKPSMFSQRPGSGPASGFFKEEHPYFARSSPQLQPLNKQSPSLQLNRPGELGGNELRQQMQHGSPQVSVLQHSREGPSVGSYAASQTSTSHGHGREDRFTTLGSHQALHSRNSSLTAGSHNLLEQGKDIGPLRRQDAMGRPLSYAPIASQSPMSTPIHSHAIHFGRQDNSSPSQPASAEAAKPAPPKRSNLMSILNNDPPEPVPEKRTSHDSQKRSTFLSPRSGPIDSPASAFDPRMGPRQDEHSVFNRHTRTPIGHSISGPNGPQILREPQHGINQSAQNTESWMDRFDPRHSGRAVESALHQSPRHYSVVPPPSNPSNVLSSLQGLRNEQRSLDPTQPDHRRSLLGPMNHPGSNPSPPPQQGPQAIRPYRSLSNSSQHGRVGSLGFQQQQASGQQQSQLMQQPQQPAGPPSHPQSTSSTPVSALHHQSRSSMDYPSQRLTIQQHIAAQQHQTHSDPRSRDHEIAVLRQREHDAERRRIEERDVDPRRRELMGLGQPRPEPQNPHHQQQQSQHQQQHSSFFSTLSRPSQFGLGHAQEPLPRTYTSTPPSFAGPNGPDPATSYLQHASQQQQEQQLQQQEQQRQQQAQQQAQDDARRSHPLGIGLGHGHGHGHVHGHGHGHFRGFSQDTREERR